jgi:hypothetical protein
MLSACCARFGQASQQALHAEHKHFKPNTSASASCLIEACPCPTFPSPNCTSIWVCPASPTLVMGRQVLALTRSLHCKFALPVLHGVLQLSWPMKHKQHVQP